MDLQSRRALGHYFVRFKIPAELKSPSCATPPANARETVRRHLPMTRFLEPGWILSARLRRTSG